MIKGEHSALRDLGGFGRANVAAYTVAAVAALAAFAVTLLIALLLLRPELAAMSAGGEDNAEVFASAVAQDLSRAVDLGIPLERMRGVQPYLDTIVRSAGAVDAIAILDDKENTLFTTGPVSGAVLSVRAPIVAQTGVVGAIAVAPSLALAHEAAAHTLATALAVAALVAVLSGVIVRISLFARVNLPQARLGASGSAVARGNFAAYAQPPLPPVRTMGRAAGQLVADVLRDRRQLMFLADEVRALDTDRALREDIDRALTPTLQYRFLRPYNVAPQLDPFLWWPFLALALFMAQRPLVGSFAADRVDPSHGAYAIAAASAAFALAAIVGLGAAWLLGGKVGRWLTVLALAMFAATTGVTVVLRDPFTFTLCQAGAGFSGTFVIARLMLVPHARDAMPVAPSLLLLAALLVGPTLGALLAEAEGRRMAFASIGGLSALLCAVMVFAPMRRPSRALTRSTRAPRSHLLAATLIGAGLAIVLEYDLGAHLLREDYAGLALSATILGASAAVPGLVASMLFGKSTARYRQFCLFCGFAVVGAVALVVLAAGPSVLPTYALAALFGLGIGLLVLPIGAGLFPLAPFIFGGSLIGALSLAATGALDVSANLSYATLSGAALAGMVLSLTRAR